MDQNKKELITPVLFIIFNRPDTARVVFDAIRKARPKELFVSADGPRDMDGEAALCKEAREIIKQVDWDCRVYTRFNNENLGCKIAVSSAINWFFEHVESGIIIEDDCLPNQSFFRFCQELLEKYKDDERIMQISGSSYLLGKIIGEASYCFAKLNDIWGWATWKRAWKLYDIEMKNFPLFKKQEQIENYLGDKKISAWLMSYFEEAFNAVGSKHGIWSSQWSFAMCMHNGLTIVPNLNLVSNIGINAKATNSNAAFKEYNQFRTFELDEITHPQFILPSKEADALRFKLIRKTDPRLKKIKRLERSLRSFVKNILFHN